MKQNLLFSLSIIAILFMAPSCKKAGGKTGLLVPKNAAIVVHVNSASLSSKLSWDEIRQTNWFKELSKQTTDTMAQQLLADPAISGIDANADFVCFIMRQGRGSYMAINGSLKDAAAYEAYAKKIGNGAAISKDGDFSAMPVQEAGVLSWNKSHFIYIADVPIPDMKGVFEGSRSSEPFKFTADSLQQFGKDILTLKAGDRLDADSRFAALVKDGSDMHFWMNTGAYYGGLLGPVLSMMKLNVLLDDNISASSFNFDNGKITMDAKQYYGKEMSKLLSAYRSKPVSTDVVNRIPSSDVIGALVFNYPPEGIKEFLKVIGMDGMAGMLTAQTGFNIDDFIKATKGDLLLVVSDVEMKEKTDTVQLYDGGSSVHTSTKPDAKVLFATSVNDKAAFEKLIGLAATQMKKNPMGKPGEITYKLENNWFAAGNSADYVNKFLSGSNNKSAIADKISGHPIGLFLDLQKIFQIAAADAKDTIAKAGIDAALKTWQDIVATGGEYEDKAIKFHAEINMVDKTTNSLKQLNIFLNQMSILYADKLKKNNMDFDIPRVDTVEIIPADSARMN